MAISAVGALASTISANIAGTLFFGNMLAHFAITTAMGAALKALSPKPDTSSGGYTVTARGANLDHQIIYGRSRVAGAVVGDFLSNPGATEGNRYLHRITAMAGHEIESYDEVWINSLKVLDWKHEPSGTTGITNLAPYYNTGDSMVPATMAEVDEEGNVVSTEDRYSDGNILAIEFWTGSPNQTASPHLMADIPDNKWTSNHRLRGVAYISTRFGYHRDRYPDGLPEVTATIKGKKVYDPRSGSTAWSDNPCLCLRDYLTSDYGLGEETTRIDDSLVSTGANVCDETNTLAGTTRYTCNGAFTTALQPYDVIDNLLTSMGGSLWYAQGEWRMKPAYWTAPVALFTEDDLRSTVDVSTRHSRRDNFNTISGSFRGPETKWATTGFPEVTQQAFIDADGGHVSSIDVPLMFTDNSIECRRHGRIILERNRHQLTVSASFGMRALSVQVGDNIQLTLDRFGWSSKEFEVIAWSFGLSEGNDLQVQLTLRETSSSAFDEIDDGVTLEPSSSSRPPQDFGLIVSNLTQVPFTRINTDGSVQVGSAVSWDGATSALVTNYEVRWKQDADAVYQTSITPEESIEIVNLIGGKDYTVEVRAVTHSQQTGPWALLSFTAGQDDTIPKAPTGVVANGAFQSTSVRWFSVTQNTDNTDLDDLSHYNIYRHTQDDPINATRVGSSIDTRFGDVNLDNATLYFYWVTAVDKSGNESAKSAHDTTTTTQISAAEMVADIREEIGAARVDVVSSLPSSGYSAGEFVYLTTDSKLYEYNGSSWVAVVAEVEDGSITETKIGNNSISTGKLQTNAVRSYHILSGEIDTGHLSANSITSGKISTGAVSADKIAVNTLAAINANLGTVTAGSLDTRNGAGTGLEVNIAGQPSSVYIWQNSLSTYGLYCENTYSGSFGGGAAKFSSGQGYTVQIVQSGGGSGVRSFDSQNIDGGHGLVGVSSGDGGYAFEAERGDFQSNGGSYLTFTGTHQGYISKEDNPEVGDIVVDVEMLERDISETFGVVSSSTLPNDPSAVGVYVKTKHEDYLPSALSRIESTGVDPTSSSQEPSTVKVPKDEAELSSQKAIYDIVDFNAVGEGLINVCGENGDIQRGDLIVTSNTKGKGMKQLDDIVRSYTVAKARESVTFSDPTEVKSIACIYMCG
jgi:hypothetical protein